MNTVTRNSRFLVLAALLVVLMLANVVSAQSPEDCTPPIPQWVIDRQQYEIGFVYVPPANSAQAPTMAVSIPQWVRDRKQYETNYIYVPPADDAPLAGVVAPVPQSLRASQQFVPTLIYQPPEDIFVLEGAHC